MKAITFSQLRNAFDQIADLAALEPVIVKESGRPSVILICFSEYERLCAIEDGYWAARALNAEASGYASQAEVQRLLDDQP